MSAIVDEAGSHTMVLELLVFAELLALYAVHLGVDVAQLGIRV